MYCSEQVSRKIKVLSFCAMVTVVMIHADFLSLHEGVSGPTVALSMALSGIKKWAVPYFFMVSGFFFDRGLGDGALRYCDVLRRKWRALGIPYLLWGSVYGVVMFVPLTCVMNKLRGVALFSGTSFDPLQVWSVIDKVLGILRGAPANGALWYVRMLIILFLLAPVWRFLRGRACHLLLVGGLPLAVVCGVVESNCFDLPFCSGLAFDMSLGAFGYFAMGIWISVCRCEEFRMPVWLLGTMIILVVMLSLFVESCHLPLVWVIVVWGLYDWSPKLFPSTLSWIFGTSFWCYCMHLPLAGYVGAANRYVLGRGEISYWVQVVLNPALVVSICLACAWVVRKHLPRLYSVLNGGRG